MEPFAQRALIRATGMIVSAQTALAELDSMTSPRCSQEHITRMRQLTMNIPSIEEIDYFADDVLKCTSWGTTAEAISRPKTDYTTAEGLGLSFRMRPSVIKGRLMTAIHMSDHSALVLPLRFVDVVIEKEMSLAVMTDEGRLLNHLGPPNLQLARSLLDGPERGVMSGDVYVVARRNGLVAAITVPTTTTLAKLRQEQAVFLPIGAATAALVIGIVIWFSKRRLSPLAELEVAIRNREFIVHYQPIIQLSSGACVGAEALVRWRRPDGSIVRPDLFIPLAEESGLIKPITDQVVDVVISDLAPHLAADRTLHIAINLSADDIATGRALDMIDAKLKPTQIHPQQIWLEATERGFMKINEAKATLQRARERGYSVAIDDFGTGYSSLQYLQGLPVDALKIDKSFVDTIGKDTATSAVTAHIIEIAMELGLHTVAEGIETEDQLAYLNVRNVGFGQGWLFSKPLAAKEFLAFQQARKAAYGASPEVIPSAVAQERKKSRRKGQAPGVDNAGISPGTASA